MRFEAVAELCERLERESSRNALVAMTAEFLEQSGETVEHVVRFILAIPVPPWEPPLDVSAATVSAALRDLLGDVDRSSQYAQTGDFGETVRRLCSNRPTKQSTLLQEHLTVGEVARSLTDLARIGGEGSRRRKAPAVKALLATCSPLEAKLLVKMFVEGARHGVKTGLMEEAIAKAFGVPLDLTRRATMLSGDLGTVASVARSEGAKGLAAITVEPGRPFLPMLADRAEDAAAAIREHGTSSLEVKMDGARVELHRNEERVWVFSRRLTDITTSFPELVPALHGFKTDLLVLEGEILAVTPDGKPRPFQDLSRRIRRVTDVPRLMNEVPVRLFLFDALRIGEDVLLDEPYRVRRQLLEELVRDADIDREFVQVMPRIETGDAQVAEKFFRDAKAQGHEGFVAKRLDGKYEPGKRGKLWLKVKEPVTTLDLVVTAAEWGTGYRHKWLSDWHLAVRKEGGEVLGQYSEVGKTYQGLTDKELEEMTEKLRALELRSEGGVVWLQPEVVAEVAFDNVQRSTRYPSGFALRFARIVRVRDDLDPKDAATVDDMRAVFERQSGVT